MVSEIKSVVLIRACLEPHSFSASTAPWGQCCVPVSWYRGQNCRTCSGDCGPVPHGQSLVCASFRRYRWVCCRRDQWVVWRWWSVGEAGGGASGCQMEGCVRLASVCWSDVWRMPLPMVPTFSQRRQPPSPHGTYCLPLATTPPLHRQWRSSKRPCRALTKLWHKTTNQWIQFSLHSSELNRPNTLVCTNFIAHLHSQLEFASYFQPVLTQTDNLGDCFPPPSHGLVDESQQKASSEVAPTFERQKLAQTDPATDKWTRLETNPGPLHPKYLCGICSKACITNQHALSCSVMCDKWIHKECVGITTPVYLQLGESKDPWTCPNCQSQNNFSRIYELVTKGGPKKDKLASFFRMYFVSNSFVGWKLYASSSVIHNHMWKDNPCFNFSVIRLIPFGYQHPTVVTVDIQVQDCIPVWMYNLYLLKARKLIQLVTTQEKVRMCSA